MTGIKISIVTILALGFSTAFFFNSVYALAGSGTAKDPYIVSIEDELRDVLLTKSTKSWVYVGVKKSITITRNIAISKGKFKIYAYDSNVTLKRSSDGEKSINGGEYPKYCMTLSGTTEIDMGVTATKSKTLTLGGNKSNFSTKKRSSGWLYLKSGTKATINSNCVVKNVMNNKEEDGGSAIFTFGTLILNGTIENCEGSDGGAIGVKKGSVTITGQSLYYKGSVKLNHNKAGSIGKKSQKITTAKINKIKASAVKKKTVKISLKTKASGKGKITYKVKKYPKGMKKYISISKKGVVTFKKKAKRGTYKIEITAAAKGNYKKTTKIVTIKVK